MIAKCECGDFRTPAASFQNEKYGFGMRVQNKGKGASAPTLKCTVCGKSKGVSVPKAVTKSTK